VGIAKWVVVAANWQGEGEEGVAVGVVDEGWGGGATEKTGDGVGEGNKTREALQSIVTL
jgi:hypothetical protein